MDDLIPEIAMKHNVNPELIQRLIGMEKSKVHLWKRRGVKDELRKLIEEHIEEIDE